MLRRAALALVVVLLAGCVYYPTVMDTGGVRIRTENGRLVRQGMNARVYFDVTSSGKYGDFITGVTAPFARQAQLVNANGSTVTRLEIPGATIVKFAADGTFVQLTDLTKPLPAGDSVIVTLTFEKSGGIGIVTLVSE